MVTSTNEPQAVMDLQADNQGNWQAQLPANLSPGLHKVIVQSEDGTVQDLALFNLQTNVQMVTQQARQEAYGQYLYPLALLTVLVLLLAANNLRMVVQAKKNSMTIAKKQKYATLASVLVALMSLVVFGYVSLQSGWLNFNVSGSSGSARIDQAPIVQAPTRPISVSGSISDPLTKQGVANVDLTVGEVSIRTQEGGRFVFTDIPTGTFIKLTNPELKKVLLWQAQPDSSGEMDIYFNTDMFNALIEVIDDEVGNHLNKVYAQMPSDVRSNISEQDFMARYKPFYAASDFSAQSIKVLGSSVQDNWASPYDTLSDKAISAILSNGQDEMEYHLVFESNQWRVIR